MRVLIPWPTTIQLIEKAASTLLPRHTITVFPLVERLGAYGGSYAGIKRKLPPELASVGYDVAFLDSLTPDQARGKYDLLIDSWETRHYYPEWRERCLDWQMPRLIKVLWKTQPETDAAALDLFRCSAISTEAPSNTARWLAAIDAPVTTLLYYPGDWWFDTPWRGVDARLLFVLTNLKSRQRINAHVKAGYTLFRSLQKQGLPGYHYDGHGGARLPPLEMARRLAQFRAYANLDLASSTRSLCLVFFEMMALGVPTLVIDRPQLDYWRYVEDGVDGYRCADWHELLARARQVLGSTTLARRLSDARKERAREVLDKDRLLVQWEAVFDVAVQRYKGG